MTDSWATFAHSLDFHLDLRPEASGRRGNRAALLRSLRAAISSGRLAPGTRLPSSRALAADLGVARNTVAEAYAELVAEGWLTARQGSGTRVAERPAAPVIRAEPSAPPRHPLDPDVTYNLMPGLPDASAFPRTAWATATRRALAAAPSSAFRITGPAGRIELRTALAEYLARARGVRSDPGRIVTCGGFIGGLRLIGRVLRERGVRRIGVEAFGLPLHRQLLVETGLTPIALPHDAEGPDPTTLDASDVQAVLLTPAHQFPTGVPLSPSRRAAVVGWARASGGYVLEDDYDGEFRYDRQPIGALQGLDPDHVVYCGTASKSLSPALRLGWLAVPDRLLAATLRVQAELESWTSAVDELTLADFIGSGGYDHHIRSSRLRYRRRRDHLVRSLADSAPQVRVTGIAAGLHVLIELPAGTEPAALSAARAEQVAVQQLDFFRFGDPPPLADTDALVVGYGAPPDHLYPAALAALTRALSRVADSATGARMHA